MTAPLFRFLAFALSCFVAAASQAQVIQVVGTFVRGMNILEFYEAAVVNPQQIFVLSVEIQNLLRNVSTRYKDLSNDFAQKAGWFSSGPLGLEYIELKPEPSPVHQYGYYSITLKKLKSKECKFLSNHEKLSQNFVSIELNGNPLFVNGKRKQMVVECKSQWFFQDGKNELKYVSY